MSSTSSKGQQPALVVRRGSSFDMNTSSLRSVGSTTRDGDGGGRDEAVAEARPPADNNNEGISSGGGDMIGLVTFDQVLDLIPAEEKRAYLEAARKCPDLVATESDPAHFIVREDYNVWAAARRLASYWETRLEVFGTDRAFLPLNLTGQGALDAEDIATLKTGWQVLLPRDTEGRPVVCMDVGRGVRSLGHSLSPQSMARTSFYLRSAFSHEEIAQEEGFVSFIVYSEAYMKVKETAAFQRLMDTLLETLPVRTKAVFVTKCERWNFFQKIAPLVKKHFANSMAESMIPVTVDNDKLEKNKNKTNAADSSSSSSELLRKLEAYHFTQPGLPPSLGGSWSYGYFDHWLAEEGGCPVTGFHEERPELRSYLQSYSSSSTSYTSSQDNGDDANDKAANSDSKPAAAAAAAAVGTASTMSEQEPEQDLPAQVSTMTTMLSDFYEALDMVPFEQKSAYLQAVEHCPALVDQESNPRWFLQCERNNPWAAARRFINYWHHRKALFGQERAFLPMNATGKGTLREDEIGSILYGALSFLPNTKSSQSSLSDRPVIWYDRSKPIAKAGRASRLRWWFYAMSMVHDMEAAQCNGVVLVMVFGAAFFKQAMVASMAPDLWEMIRIAFPIRKLHIHIVCKQTQDLTASMIESGLPLVVERCGRDAIVHKAETSEEMLQKLERNVGLERSGIPAEFGGTWTEKDHDAWRDARLRREWELQEKYSRSVSPSSSRKLLGFGARRSGGFRMKKGRFFAANTAGNGNSSTSDEAHNAARESIKELQEAIDGMTVEEKVDYCRAVHTVPNLVQTESNPEIFLTQEKQEARAAAVRLVTYWRRRREIFGDRAFLPMNLSDRGVMTAQDMVALNKGFLLNLPQDAQGTSVLWMSGQPDAAQEIRLRVLFYMLHVVCENSKTQEGGFVMLHAISEETRGDLRAFDDLVRQAFPASLAAVHLLCISTESAATARSVDVVIPAALEVLSKPFLDNTFIHVVQTEDEMRGQLEWCGFSKDGLPSVVGGDIVLDQFLAAWIRGRNLAESSTPEKMDAGSCNQSVSSVASMPNVEVQRSSVEDMEEAIQLLPDADKTAYLEANEKVPDLLAKESNPSWYLRHEKYDICEAAKRLTAYWTKRKSVFGKRAFLPMNMTGEGALSREAVAYLSTGSLVFLPEDNKGRSILYYDASRTGGTELGPQLEVMLYLALLCAQNSMSQSEGVVILFSMNKVAANEQIPQMLDVGQVLPFSWHSVHLISKAANKLFVEEVVPWAKGFLESKRLGDKGIIHKAGTKKEILEKLLSHGLVKAGLPQSLGGDWSYAQHARWQEQRIRIEWDLPITGSDAAMFKSTAKRRRDLTEEEKIERKRRYNVIHSRRKRERDRVEVEVLRTQVNDLKESNENTEEENGRLERLLVEAQELVKNTGEPERIVEPQKSTLKPSAQKSNGTSVSIMAKAGLPQASSETTASTQHARRSKAPKDGTDRTPKIAIEQQSKPSCARAPAKSQATQPTAVAQSNAKRQRVSADVPSVSFHNSTAKVVAKKKAANRNGGVHESGSDESPPASRASLTVDALRAARSSGTKRMVSWPTAGMSATVNALRATTNDTNGGDQRIGQRVSATVNALRAKGTSGSYSFNGQMQAGLRGPVSVSQLAASAKAVHHNPVGVSEQDAKRQDLEGLDAYVGTSPAPSSLLFNPINTAKREINSQQMQLDGSLGARAATSANAMHVSPLNVTNSLAGGQQTRLDFAARNSHVAGSVNALLGPPVGVNDQAAVSGEPQQQLGLQVPLFASQTVADALRGQRSSGAVDYTGGQQQQQQMGLFVPMSSEAQVPSNAAGFRLFSIQQSGNSGNDLRRNSFVQGQPEEAPGQDAPLIGLALDPLAYGRPRNLVDNLVAENQMMSNQNLALQAGLEPQQQPHVPQHNASVAAAALAASGTTTSLTGDERLDMLVRRIAGMSNTNGQAATDGSNQFRGGRTF